MRASTKVIELSITDIHVELYSEDTFGRVSSSSIHVHGQLRKATVTTRKRISAGGVDLTWELRTMSNKLLGTAFMDSDDLKDGTQHVDCLILDENVKGQALILEKIADDSSDYIRIGVAELLGLDSDHDFFEKSHEQFIRLV
jgi:hypothetical protein